MSHMLERPVFPPGFRWLRMELKRSEVVMIEYRIEGLSPGIRWLENRDEKTAKK